MTIEVTTFVIGALSSVISLLSFLLAKRAAKKTGGQKIFVIKNSKGETREVTVTPGQKTAEVIKSLNDNLAYEKLVETSLRKFSADNATLVKIKNHDLGYDFTLNFLGKKYLIEAKANKRPVNKYALEKLLKAASKRDSKAVLFSKSGFEKAALKWLETQPGAAKLTLKTAKNKDEIKKAMREFAK